ncbi:MAG: maleylacetate reductase [Sphingomonas sp.]
MIDSFLHEMPGSRVVFGAGAISKIPREAERLSMTRPLVLSTPGQKEQAERVLQLLEGDTAGLFADARRHTPIDVTEAAIQFAREHRADGLIAVGGGSTTGLSKAIALRTDLPQIAVPTTYAGSELTPILGETRDGLKTTQRSGKVLPEVAIYDVALTLTLPVPVSVCSGFNAIAHAAEALYAQNCSPVILLIAEEALRAITTALPQIVADPSGLPGRNGALYGAWLSGICLGSAGMALHHKLCHVLGGTFDLPHAETHTVVLPHALRHNLAGAPDARLRIARAVGHSDPAAGLQALARQLGAPTALRDLGMPEDGLDHAAELAIRDPYWNPRPVTRHVIRELLQQAWQGTVLGAQPIDQPARNGSCAIPMKPA